MRPRRNAPRPPSADVPRASRGKNVVTIPPAVFLMMRFKEADDVLAGLSNEEIESEGRRMRRRGIRDS